MLGTLFGGWEIIFILAMLLLLFGSKKLPELVRGLGQGIDEFLKALREIEEGISHGIGQSLGGIFGKQAADAITPDNQVAELYNPAAFEEKDHQRAKRALLRRFLFCRRLMQKMSQSLAGAIKKLKHLFLGHGRN